MSEQPLVSVVDDSESVRESLPDLLQLSGFVVQAFASAEAFLTSSAAEQTKCLILDVGLPGMSGPDLQQELKRRGKTIPIVFITAQGDRARVEVSATDRGSGQRHMRGVYCGLLFDRTHDEGARDAGSPTDCLRG